ncbi:MAG TPA: hypothetical protein VK550_04930 [Polyangiaceae bacterium]|nr:hypothetical protein [Polyangiaceae bacterium]
MKTSGTELLSALALFLSACGSAASYNYDVPPSIEGQPPALARMSGKIVGDIDADSSCLNIALVWFPVSPSQEKYQVSQTVKPKWASKQFEVEISQQPPPDAIEGADMMRYGQAEVVLYEDRDGNGELDLVTRDRMSRDLILGRADGVRVWWLPAGSPATADKRGYKPVRPGLSVTYGPIEAAPEPGDCAPDHDMGGSWRPVCPPSKIKEPAKDVSNDSLFTIPMTNDPKLQAYACLGFWGTTRQKSDEWSDKTAGWYAPEVRKKICNPQTCDSTGEGGPLDLPVAGRSVQIQCNPQKTIYSWKDCEPDPKLCDTVFCHEGRGARNPDDAPPADWPAVCR